MNSKTNNTDMEKDGAMSYEQWEKHSPVVAIGASAGGLKAISDLLENLPLDLGMVYIIIQHLSPTHESILPELLQKKTSMPIRKVEDGMHVEPNNVYVIPPNVYMSIVDSKLLLSPRPNRSGAIHSIDFFFNALAPVYQSKAIAIILSGSGNDGTVGIQAIKAYGGITFAQDETASFLSMPKMASDSGYTDFILPCDRIAKELTEIIKNPEGVITQNNIAEANKNELKKILLILHNKKEVDFGYYKQTTVNRRILRRMTLNKFKQLSDYTQYLRQNPAEVDLLYKDLLINVTSFFREPAVYEAFSKKIFPEMLKDRKNTDVLRIWTPACATGEEAYSFAICLFDHLKDKALNTSIQIFGTDLSEAAIDKARAGIYAAGSLANVSQSQLKKYFIKIDGSYQIIKPIRDCCIFATHNLLKDPPFSRMDLISCQNVMIYLEANPQRKILQAFHYALKPTGYLLLGKSETIGNLTELFSQADKDLKTYSKKITSASTNLFDFSMGSFRLHGGTADKNEERKEVQQNTEIDIDKETDKLLLARYVPASIVINKDLQIVRFQGATSNFLQPSTGKASFYLLKMVKDELAFELKGLIEKSKNDQQAVRKDNIHLSGEDNGREISIEVMPMKTSSKSDHWLIVFRDNLSQPLITPKYKTTVFKGKQRADVKDNYINKLEQQITEAREYMRTMSEEFEATREELQSANEEILSSNEELQSINEELETSKEELQSANEELTTINDELHHRNTELKEMGDYLTSIVETINEPIIVINSDTRIKSANTAFFATFKTDADRTEGSYLFETGNGQWNIPEVREKLINTVQKGIGFNNVEVQHIFPQIGEKYLCFSAMIIQQNNEKNKRILIVIEDITNRKRAEKDLKENEERFRLLVENASDIIMIYSKEGTIKFQSGSVNKTLGYEVDENLGKNIFELSVLHPEDVAAQKKVFREVLKYPGKNIKTQLRLKHRNDSYRTMEVIFRNLLNNENIHGIIANYQNIQDSRII